MANKHRLRVLCMLIGGEKSVGELNAMIPVSQSVLSQHLAVLRRARLVTTRREAQVIYYSVTSGPAHSVIGTLHHEFCGKGDESTPGAAACAPPPRRRKPAVSRSRRS
jgi:DNA-binding transcriptional ArsR family regulator